jgi:hypothetical protein
VASILAAVFATANVCATANICAAGLSGSSAASAAGPDYDSGGHFRDGAG